MVLARAVALLLLFATSAIQAQSTSPLSYVRVNQVGYLPEARKSAVVWLAR